MEMIHKFGEGAEITNFQEQAHISIEAPLFNTVSPHLKHFESDNRTTTNTTNLLGYHCYLETTKILTAFLATHCYAAFQGPDKSRMDHVLYASIPLKDDVSPTVHLKTIDYSAELAARGLPPVTPSADRRAMVGFIPETHDGIWNLQSAITVAQPSPFTPYINFGPAGK